MNSLVFLIPIALLFGAVALAAFLWSLRSGQYEDLKGAAERILIDENGDRAEATTDASARRSMPAAPPPDDKG